MKMKHRKDGNHERQDRKWKYNRKNPAVSMSGRTNIGNYEPRKR